MAMVEVPGSRRSAVGGRSNHGHRTHNTLKARGCSKPKVPTGGSIFFGRGHRHQSLGDCSQSASNFKGGYIYYTIPTLISAVGSVVSRRSLQINSNVQVWYLPAEIRPHMRGDIYYSYVENLLELASAALRLALRDPIMIAPPSYLFDRKKRCGGSGGCNIPESEFLKQRTEDRVQRPRVFEVTDRPGIFSEVRHRDRRTDMTELC
eukprot:scaffold33091_cov41-Cyclotella_meneghiniana.AAC.1